ncbi:MAG TPA: LamB/YcsF family protein, partial [Pyrinomonadaceae bacterium]|nr:LamB/YcsF family protein [Pyrinomonadaceae bacterium]
TPRSEPNALINDKEKAVSQVLEMIREQSVIAATGEKVLLKSETVCIHGDGENALGFAAAIHQKLTEQEILIQSV